MLKSWMILCLFSSLPTLAGLYNIKDLEVLESNKAYKEFLDHALDVRPSARDKHWSSMVGNMATGLVKQYSSQKAYTKANFDFIEGLTGWPSLAKDDYFRYKRKIFGLSYLAKCLGHLCRSDLLSFWYTTKKQDGATAKKLVLILKEIAPSENLIPFLAKIGHDDYALSHCKKPWIQQEIFSAVTAPLRLDKLKEAKKVLNTIVGNDCWRAIRPIVHQALLKGPGLKQDYAFSLLKIQNDLTKEWEDFYYVSYFLGSPIPGMTFNKSWNRVKALGQNYGRRMQVLKKMYELDPLPGKLFSLINNKKKDTLVNYFNKNIPEYINHYSKTCLNYLSGSINFSNGNPTPDCDNLFAGGHMEDRVRAKFSALKK